MNDIDFIGYRKAKGVVYCSPFPLDWGPYAATYGAHVEYFRWIRNPVGVKVDPSTQEDELLWLVSRFFLLGWLMHCARFFLYIAVIDFCLACRYTSLIFDTE